MAKFNGNKFNNVSQDRCEHFPRKAREKSLINLDQIAISMEVIDGISEVEDRTIKTAHYKKQRRYTKRCKTQVKTPLERGHNTKSSNKNGKKPLLLSKTNGLSHFVEVKQELPDDVEVGKITYTELPLKADCHKAARLKNDSLKEIIDKIDDKETNKDTTPSKRDIFACDDKELDMLEISLGDDNSDGNLSDDESFTDRLESENIEEILPQKKRKKYPQECDICNKKLHSKANLRLHKLKVHKVKVQFHCDLCDLKFDFQRKAVQHRNSVHRGEDGRFGCDVCSKRITDYHSYLTHVKCHVETAGSADCSQSSQDDESKSNGSQAGAVELRGRLKSQDKNFICDTCGRRFAFSCLLRDHINTHTGVKPYLCQECGKAFCQKSTLKQHTRTHSDVRPFQCAECPQGFFSKSDFVKHQRKHTGERPYVCEVCGEGFSRSTHLGVHRRTHTGERPHVCDICGRGFTKRGDVVRHHRVHTGELPYLCQVCGKAFRQSTQCANHIKSQHPDSPAPVARNPNPLAHQLHLQVTC